MKIAITGGKGGTGKSTIATALAVELGKERKVLLVDMDVDCPNDHTILSMKRRKVTDVFQTIPKWDFKKCIKCGKCSEVCKQNAIVFVKDRYPIFIPDQCNGCESCLLVCPEKAIGRNKKVIGSMYTGKGYGVDLVSGELKPGQPVSEFVVDGVKNHLKGFEKRYDYLLIDTSAGTHCGVISALSGCDLALAVTEPTPLGGHDLELILKLLRILKIQGKIVLNRSDVGNSRLIERLAEKYGTEIVTRMPYKKSILKAYSRGEPVRDKNVKELAEMIKRMEGRK